MVGRMSRSSRNKPVSLAAVTISFLFTAILWLPAWGADTDLSLADRPKKLTWEMPGRLAIYDLQFGPASIKDNKTTFGGNIRRFGAAEHEDRLTLMIRFSYAGTRPDIPLRFVIRLPDARQHEEKVILREPQGSFSYKFTIHKPEEFVGSGSVYVYYDFNIVEVLDFTITPRT